MYRLYQLKKEHHLKQSDVAEIIGVSPNHYGKYERGETELPLDKAIKLARYYGVSLDYLAGLSDVRYDKGVNTKEELLAVISAFIDNLKEE